MKFITPIFCLFVNYLVAQEFSPPNILLINVDDLGWRDVGFMGSKYYETPHLDSLSSQGVVFTNGYAAAANCAPSRASLMTGLWPTRHGIYTVGSSERGNKKDRRLVPVRTKKTLSIDFKVIPQVLKEYGYTTCHAGKWHLSDDPKTFDFDVNIAGSRVGHPKSYYPPYKNITIEKGESDYLTDLITEKSIDFIIECHKPFFLYYSPYAVHLPVNPIDSLLNKYTNKRPDNGQKNPRYATMIENLDRNIGLLMKAVRGKNCFIIFTSDNGGLFGITQQKPLRAGKGSYYEGGIREPYVVVWENKIPKNSTCEIPVSSLDIFPTILSVANIPNKLKLDGHNLLQILENDYKTYQRSLYWHFPVYIQLNQASISRNEFRDTLFRTRPGSVIRSADWKLHYYFEDKSVELFNLSSDIGESHNVAEEFPDIAFELEKKLKNWWKKTNAPLPNEINLDFIK